MSNFENTKNRAYLRGEADASNGRQPISHSRAGSMWDKYYHLGYKSVSQPRG